jgi:hypothetical protein
VQSPLLSVLFAAFHARAAGVDMGIVNVAQARTAANAFNSSLADVLGSGVTLRSTVPAIQHRKPLQRVPSFLRTCLQVLQVQEDVYEKIDKELLSFVEDVLLNRRDDSTERLLEFAATLDPKSKPCKVKRLADAVPAANIPPKARRCSFVRMRPSTWQSSVYVPAPRCGLRGWRRARPRSPH